MKKCTKCGLDKPLSDFGKLSKALDGLMYHCKPCDRSRGQTRRNTSEGKSKAHAYRVKKREELKTYFRVYYKKHSEVPEWKAARETRRVNYRQENLEALREKGRNSAAVGRSRIQILKAGPCLDCNKIFPPVAMDFDHVRDDKSVGLANMQTCSLERIQDEISKCDLVCACCHRIRTSNRIPRNKNSPTIVARYQAFNALKAQPCLDCNTIFPPVAMDFDHVRGVKYLSVATLVRTSAWHRVLEEISKCDLVCACCHRLRTHSRKQYNGTCEKNREV